MNSPFAKAISAWVVQHAWAVLVLAVLAVTALSAGSASLTFRSDDRVFFSKANPELLALEDFEAQYGREDSIVFVLTAEDGDLFTPARLDAINALTDQAWHLPHVKRVDSVTNFQRVHTEGEDAEVVIDHLARSGDPLTLEQARALREVAVTETLLAGRLLTRDARVSLVAVQFRLTDDAQGDPAGELVAEARKVAAAFASVHADIDIRITGSLALDNAFGEASATDGMFLTPVMFGLIFGLIGFIFRSVSVLMSSLLIIGAAIGAAMGTAGLMHIPLSSPSVSAPFIILTLATADCIHLAAAVFRAARNQATPDKRAAVRDGFLAT
ncbi:MAG: MMPL family transporter, partial [Pseudomonadota bacterium]